MRNILYILEDGRFGGMNKMTADIATSIAKEGYKIHILVGKANSDFFIKYLISKHVPFSLISQYILSKNKSAISRYLLFFFRDIFLLFRAIKEINPDLVYCNGSQQIKGVIAAKLARKKIIWHMHDTFQPFPILQVFRMVRSFCQVKWFVASCQRSVVFYDLDAHDTLISRPPIDMSFFRPTLPKSILNSNSVVRILTVSNVNSDKGLDTLIRVAHELNKSGHLFNFTIVGLGAEDTNSTYVHLQQLIELFNIRNVTFVGQKVDIRSILSESDIYLCTSRNESGPLAVYEALAMQIPVFSTDVGDLSQLFAQYNYGKVLPIDDYASIADEIITFKNSPGLFRHKAQAGIILAKQELDISICIAKQIDFYKKIFQYK